MDNSEFYKDKVVLVTGSSMGIGKEMAKQVLILGGKVIITAHDVNRLLKVEKELEIYSDSLLVQAGDITNFETNELLVKKTIDRFGKLDVLICNAGLSGYGETEIIKPGVARQIIDVNIYGSLFPVMTAIPELKKTCGSILFISSTAGLYGLPGYSAYSLSKMALKALSQSVRIELKSSGVFVGIAYPGFTENKNQKEAINPFEKVQNMSKPSEIFTFSYRDTALKLLKQIAIKKQSEIHTLPGNLTSILSNYFPSALKLLLTKKHYKPTLKK